MSWTRIVAVCAVVTIVAVGAAGRAQAADPTGSGAGAATAPGVQQADSQSDLDQLAAKLGDENAKQEERDEAARRLMARQRDEAREILRATLVSAGNRGGQLAAARALAGDTHPDPSFIVPLFALLGPDQGLSEAAAQALAAYRGNQEVLSRLIAVASARQQSEAVRVATVKALGTFLDKRAAETLIGLLRSEDESTAVRNAAADALAELTGLRENGRDVQKWQQWWTNNSPKAEAEWQQALVNERANRLDVVQFRYNQLTNQVRSLLVEQYHAIPEGQKPEVVLRYLRASEPVIRGMGARLVVDDAENSHTIPSAVREQLRQMVGDSSAEVRIEVAGALRAINDAAALGPLLTQMAQETDPDVRAALAKALAPIRDLRALPELRKLLHDNSFVVAEAAADAIRQLGPQIREKQPQVASQIAGELREVLETRTGGPGSGRLREMCVLAMGPLREPSLLNTLYTMLRSRESREVRRAALKALGELQEPKAADVIINSLEDPDATVRLEAVDALGKIGSFEHAEILSRRLNPNEESDASVREHAWTVLAGLLSKAQKDQLVGWADRFSNDPARRLVVLQTLAKKQEKDNDKEHLAYTQQLIGETQIALNKSGDAAKSFQLALSYWSSIGQGMRTQALISQLLGALLQSRQYPEAVVFGGKLIKADMSQQQTVGSALRAEAERLQNAKELNAALALIAEAKKMEPPLSPRYLDDLQDIESQIRKQLGENRPPAAPTTGPQSARRGHLPINALRVAAGR